MFLSAKLVELRWSTGTIADTFIQSCKSQMVNSLYINTNNHSITDTFVIISFCSVRTLLKRMKSNACVFNISRPLVGVFVQADNF